MAIVRSKRRTGRRIFADDEIGNAVVDPAATDLLFEAQDVAELVAEVTGEDVEVEADENEVTFSVGDEEYTVQPDEDVEILESSRKQLRGRRPIKASTRRPVRRGGVQRPVTRK